MGLEAGDFIDDLNQAWPLPSDKRRQGDDHFRLIKRVLKNTFPNLNAAVTATPADLNNVPPNLGDIITELLLHIEAPGSIKMWDLANKPIPDGWVLCDGSTVPGYGTVPDMRDRFVVAAGVTFNNGDTGGVNPPVAALAGGGAITIAGHALTRAELPAVSPRLYVWESGSNGPGQMENFGNSGIGPARGVAGNADSNTYAYREKTDASVGAHELIENLGDGAEHTHAGGTIDDHTHTVDLPPYYSGVFIVKVSEYEAP